MFKMEVGIEVYYRIVTCFHPYVLILLYNKLTNTRTILRCEILSKIPQVSTKVTLQDLGYLKPEI